MEQSENINEIAAALSKAQGQIKGALKDSTNPFFKAKYADLSSVWEACRGPLSGNGLAVVQTTSDSEKGIAVITSLVHSSGQWFRGHLTLEPKDKTPQGYGSAITYARRYALAAIVGVAPEDDDGNSASEKKAKEAPIKITPEKVDENRVNVAADWFIKKIDEDSIDETHEKVQTFYSNLTNNERLAVDALLQDKAPNSNKAYKSLLKEYLAYKPAVTTYP